MSFLHASVLVGFVGSLEDTTFLVRDSYKPLFAAGILGRGYPKRKEKSTVDRPFTLRTPRKGGASIGTLTLVDLAGTEKDVTYHRWSGGVGVCFLLESLRKKGGLFWEKGWKVLFCDVGWCYSILMFLMSILGDQKNRKQVQNILYVHIYIWNIRIERYLLQGIFEIYQKTQLSVTSQVGLQIWSGSMVTWPSTHLLPGAGKSFGTRKKVSTIVEHLLVFIESITP